MCIAQAPSDQDGARIRSCQGHGAGSRLQAIPLAPKFVLKPSEFQLASSLRLGIPLPFSQVVTQCDCGACLDKYGYHLLTCKYGGGPVWQHNTIVSTWAKCLDELSIPHQVEPRNRYADSENRPDVIAYDPDGWTYHH